MLNERMASLLSSGKYSDLTIICRDQKFRVHRAVLCFASRFFAAACDGNFQEAQTAKVDLSDDDPGALRRALTYLYTEDYDDTDPDMIEESARDPGPISVNPIVHTSSGATGTSYLNNARVYALAEKYDIQGLKALAIFKFEKYPWGKCTDVDIVTVLPEVYYTTPATDQGLRDIVVDICLLNLDHLPLNVDFRDIVQNDGALACDILTKSSRYFRPMLMKTRRFSRLQNQKPILLAYSNAACYSCQKPLDLVSDSNRDDDHALRCLELIRQEDPDSRMARSGTSSPLLALPGETFEIVMAFAMASEKPAQLWRFIDLVRDSQKYACVDRSAWTYTDSFKRIWWLDRLPNTQREHYLDWVLVNRTCHLFRQCGRPAFFREKDFSVSRRSLDVLRDLDDAGTTSEDLVLAKDCVRKLVTPIEGSYPLEALKLRGLRLFRQIRSLSICVPIVYRMGRISVPILEESAVEKQSFPVTKFGRQSKELGDLLDVLGVNVDKLTINWRMIHCRDSPQPFEVSEQRKIFAWLLSRAAQARETTTP
ncbi:MAG: hypothetical protein Q9200_000005 [Gallowayella weberi]